MSITSVTLPSAFAAGSYSPAFDPTESNSANVVTGEQQVIVANFGTDIQFVVPSYAPFFADSVEVTFTDALTHVTTPMNPASDYFFGFPFIGASRACGKPVFGCLVIANNRLSGTLTFNYHTLGGDWVQTPAIDLAVEAMTSVDPYITAWEQVVNYNESFPVITAPWDRVDGTSMRDLIGSVLSFAAAIGGASASGQVTSQQAITHVFETDNPHQDSAAQIGLENVANLPAATDAQAADINNTTTYITPAQLALAFQAGVGHAQDNALGTIELNDGTGVNASNDLVKALTAQGFLNLVDAPDNPLGEAFNHSQTAAGFSPWPFGFPCMWNGSSYPNMAALRAAVENASGVSPLEFSAVQGKFWFPTGVTPPSLVIG